MKFPICKDKCLLCNEKLDLTYTIPKKPDEYTPFGSCSCSDFYIEYYSYYILIYKEFKEIISYSSGYSHPSWIFCINDNGDVEDGLYRIIFSTNDCKDLKEVFDKIKKIYVFK